MPTHLEISATEALNTFNTNKDILLIDVREQHEWDNGHVDGAKHLPLSTLQEGHRPDIAKDANILLYCLKGMRSLQALHILKSQGYENLTSVRGGFSELQKHL